MVSSRNPRRDRSKDERIPSVPHDGGHVTISATSARYLDNLLQRTVGRSSQDKFTLAMVQKELEDGIRRVDPTWRTTPPALSSVDPAPAAQPETPEAQAPEA